MQQMRKTKIILDSNIEWLLNLTDCVPRFELLQSNFKPLPKPINQADCLLQSNLYTYIHDTKKFELVQVLLYPNMIVRDNKFLILSTCILEKKKISYKEYTALGMLIENSLGQTHLFFTQYQDLMDWSKQLKKFIKLQNFLLKFTIKERGNVPNVFACVKNKTNQVYTVQIYRLVDFEKNPALYEQLMNEINILMSLKHPSLLNYNSLYEDNQHLYIVYEYWVGDPLFKLIEQGLTLNSNQTSKIIFQIIRFAKFLHKNNLYHGQITPSNIILIRNIAQKGQNNLQIALYNFGYREEIIPQQFTKRIPRDWVPPEIFTNQMKQPYKIDQYQVGCTLFYMTCYKPTIKANNIQSFHKTVEKFKVDYECLKLESKNKQSPFSTSQLDLLYSLMNPDPKLRKEMKELGHHHWFVNEEAKSKSISKNKLLPSLRTILEIREQSSMELITKMQRQGDYPVSIQSFDNESDEEDNEINFLHLISEEDNHLPSHLAILNFQTFSIRKQ